MIPTDEYIAGMNRGRGRFNGTSVRNGFRLDKRTVNAVVEFDEEVPGDVVRGNGGGPGDIRRSGRIAFLLKILFNMRAP